MTGRLALYFGWRIVSIAVLVYMLVLGTTTTAFGLFVVPVSTDLGLSRADMNSALILVSAGNAALSPLIGRMLDRFPARRIMMSCAILFGVSLVTLGLSHSLWLNIAVLSLMLPGATQGVSIITLSVLLARWFTVKRGRAMMLAAMGMSLASIIVTPIVGWILTEHGWRSTLTSVGVAAGVLLFLLANLVRERPGANDREVPFMPVAATPVSALPNQPAPIIALLRQRQFWVIGVSSSIATGIIQAIAITIVPLGLEHGAGMMQATSLVSMSGIAALSGKFILSFLADRIERTLLLCGFYMMGAGLSLSLYCANGISMLMGCAVLLGFSAGAIAPLLYALLADRFGAASFGTVRGLVSPLLAVSGAIAMRMAGEVYDRTGSYSTLFLLFVAAQIVAACLMYAARPDRRQPRHHKPGRASPSRLT
ncbi:MFS transporter [Sphingobium tyrosinilyticum]|uniref:MFS transporter n=1 Tax=Sphingobium tyrosinilyticum TaxID=2715436 RepID=A0ABV9F4H5_9SPHN